MIGFSVPVRIYNNAGDMQWETVIFSLDEDSGEVADGKPQLDVRLAGSDDYIGTADVEDVYQAVTEVQHQLNAWMRAHREADSVAP